MSVVAMSVGQPSQGFEYQSVYSVAGESHSFAVSPGAEDCPLRAPQRTFSTHSYVTACSRVVLNFDQLTTPNTSQRPTTSKAIDNCCSCACFLFAKKAPHKSPNFQTHVIYSSPLPVDITKQLTAVDELREVLAIDGDPAGLQRLVVILLHKLGRDASEDLDILEKKLKTPYIEHSEFIIDFRINVRERLTAMDFRQMMCVVENIFSPLRKNLSLNIVIDIFMNQWNVKIRPVAMHLEEYRTCTKKLREYNKKRLTEEEKYSGEKFDDIYRNTNLRKLMDLDNDPRVTKNEGGPLSVQAITWAKCIIEFFVSIFNLFLKVCPGSTSSISDYLKHVEQTGIARSLSPYQIFGDSNLYHVLPRAMRIMVSTALRGKTIGPQQIFSDEMVQVFGDSISVVRALLDDLRAVTCLLGMLLEAGT